MLNERIITLDAHKKYAYISAMKNIFYIIGLALLVFGILRIRDLSAGDSGKVMQSNQVVMVK